jgi:hypothetical protein
MSETPPTLSAAWMDRGGPRAAHRIIGASVKDMLSAYRIQAQVGRVSEQALEAILFRAAHPIVSILAPYLADQRAALLPSVVRIMLAAFLEETAAMDNSK